MKRLILSLAVLFSIFFLAESAFAEASNLCDKSSTITQVEVPIPGTNCVAIVRFCCKPHTESWNLVDYQILSISIPDASNCIPASVDLSNEFYVRMRDSILKNGCNGQVYVKPCEEEPWDTQAQFFFTSCYKVTWDKVTDMLVYDYEYCYNPKDPAKCQTLIKYCRDKTGVIRVEIVDKTYNAGDCEPFDKVYPGFSDIQEYLVHMISNGYDVDTECFAYICADPM